jgi:hypothetical protein
MLLMGGLEPVPRELEDDGFERSLDILTLKILSLFQIFVVLSTKTVIIIFFVF